MIAINGQSTTNSEKKDLRVQDPLRALVVQEVSQASPAVALTPSHLDQEEEGSAVLGVLLLQILKRFSSASLSLNLISLVALTPQQANFWVLVLLRWRTFDVW